MSTGMPRLHFDRAEYGNRVARTTSRLKALGYDAILIFRSEDMYWLSGLDTDGFYVFNCLLLTADGRFAYLGRQADYNNVAYSSIIDDARVVDEISGGNRSLAIRSLLGEYGLAGGNLAVQYDAMGHRADLYVELAAALSGFCRFSDASRLVPDLRLVKSPAEIAMMRRSGAIVAKMVEVAVEDTRAGAFEGTIFGKLAAAIYENDGDPCALRYPIGCGPASKLSRYTTGRSTVAATDQFMYEMGCGYRHYHTVVYFHVLVGDVPRARLERLLSICVEAREAGFAAMRPGNRVDEVHRAVASVYRRYGLDDAVRNSYGYPLGICFPPTWVSSPMITRQEGHVIEENTTLFLHPSLTDPDTGMRVSSGETVQVLADRVERLTHAPAHLIVN